MSNKEFVIALLVLAMPVVGLGQEARPIGGTLIPAGTVAIFAATRAIDSATAKVGDVVQLRLAKPVYVHGTPGTSVLPLSMLATGKVVEVRRAGRHNHASRCMSGCVRIRIQTIQLPDGDKVTARLLPPSTSERYKPFAHTAAMAKFTGEVMRDPKDAMAGDLGPLPLVLPGFLPLVVVKDSVVLAVRSTSDLVMLSQKGRACPANVHEYVIDTKMEIPVAITQDVYVY